MFCSDVDKILLIVTRFQSEQPSDKSKKEPVARKIRKKRGDKPQQTKLIVKLPESAAREGSVKSNHGNFGSESEDVNDDVTERNYGFFPVITSEPEYSDSEDDFQSKGQRSDEFSLTLAKHKSSLRRKGEESSHYITFIQSLPSVTTVEADLPHVNSFHAQNPFSLQYKERSFFIKASDSERPSGSARLDGRRQCNFSSEHPDVTVTHASAQLQDKKSDLFGKTRGVKVDVGSMADIQVFGKKPDGVPIADLPPPPNTPTKQEPCRTARRRTPKKQLNPITPTQKRSKTDITVRIGFDQNIHGTLRFFPVNHLVLKLGKCDY